MIRIDVIRQDTRHPGKRRRHQGRASCQVAGRRFEAQGPAPVYRLVTLLWLHGHGAARTLRSGTTAATPASPAAWPCA